MNLLRGQGLQCNMITINAAISASASCWRMALALLASADNSSFPTGMEEFGAEAVEQWLLYSLKLADEDIMIGIVWGCLGLIPAFIWDYH